MNINIAIVGGRLTRDPRVTTSPKGTAITELSLAVNRTYAGEDERCFEETTFVDAVCWARTAELVAQHCRKGSPVLVRGRLQFDRWEHKDTGEKRSKLRVLAESIDFLEQKRAESGAAGQVAAAKGPQEKKDKARHDNNQPFEVNGAVCAEGQAAAKVLERDAAPGQEMRRISPGNQPQSSLE